MIRTPPGWGADMLAQAYRSMTTVDPTQAAAAPGAIQVRRIGLDDLRWALRRGFEDFTASRTDILFLCLIYPLVGLVLARAASGYGLLPLVFPLASGFALIGPLAAVGLNEMSRRRERGEPVSIATAFAVFRSPAIGSILLLGILLLGMLLFWLAVRGSLDLLKEARGWWDVVAGTIVPPVVEDERPLLAQAERLLPPEPWDDAVWTHWLEALVQATGRGAAGVLPPLRLALTGEDTGPDLDALLPLIGRARASERLRLAAA